MASCSGDSGVSKPNISENTTTNLLLRVLNPFNKSRHEAFSFKNVPRFETVIALKQYILENYPVETGVKSNSFALGYYAEPNNHRCTMVSEVQLGEAMSLEKRGWIKLWLDKAPGGKRTQSTVTAAAASKKSKPNGKPSYNPFHSINIKLFLLLQIQTNEYTLLILFSRRYRR